MKVILTEEQMRLVKLIKENEDFAERIKTGISNIKDSANKLYNIITFTTIAEYRDGDSDVSIMEKTVEELDDKLSNISRKISDYYDRYDEDTYYDKFEDIHSELEDRVSITNKKIWALYDIVKQLKPFSKVDEYGDGRENDWDAPFDDIAPIEI